MIRVLSAAAVLLTTSVLAQDIHPFSVEDLVRLNRVEAPSISPDGKTVAFQMRETDIAANRGRYDLWSLDLTKPDAQPRRLTSDPENDTDAEWSHDGAFVYFLSSRGGSSQIWRLPIAGGDAEQVTNYPLDVSSFKLAPNDKLIALSIDVFADCPDLECTSDRLHQRSESKTTGRTFDRLFVRHWDAWDDHRISQLFVADLHEGKAAAPQTLSGLLDADVPSKPFGDRSEYTFSPDSTRVVFSARIKGKSEPWSTNFDLFEVPVQGGEPHNLTSDNPAWDTQPVFSPDGSQLAWRAMSRPGFESDRFRIVIQDLKSSQRRVLAEAWDRSADFIAFAANGKTIYATADHFGQHPLWAIDVKSGKQTLLTGPGHVDSFSVGPREIVFALSSLNSPAELYSFTIRGGGLRELPKMNTAKLAQTKMGEPEQFTFIGANNETVYGFVMRPANFDARKRYPVAFIVHGGPQVSFSNAWSYRWNPQTYAGLDYASIFIDFHGSPGYGQAFTDSISGDWGGKPLEDLQKGLAAAQAKFPWLNTDRMCALGASYGGYMVNWMAGNWSEPFKCFVTHDGVFDSRAMAYATDELWFDEWEHGGPQFEVPQNFEKFNPVNHVADFKVPMLVIHGEQDFRIPYSQGIGLFTALQRRGIPSRLLVYPNENHWVLKPANSIQWHHEVEKWLGRWTGK
ncbi:MAG TPA: S9 family peptidase [Steroidobacteraceae bacterium]|nr:S9 family peptidase [Steroidobacteraceae bacterium]